MGRPDPATLGPEQATGAVKEGSRRTTRLTCNARARTFMTRGSRRALSGAATGSGGGALNDPSGFFRTAAHSHPEGAPLETLMTTRACARPKDLLSAREKQAPSTAVDASVLLARSFGRRQPVEYEQVMERRLPQDDWYDARFSTPSEPEGAPAQIQRPAPQPARDITSAAPGQRDPFHPRTGIRFAVPGASSSLARCR